MPKDDEKTVAAMDVHLPNVGEIIGGSQREDRIGILEQRILAQGFNPEDYGWYSDRLRFGSLTPAGHGLGFERIVYYFRKTSVIARVRVPRSFLSTKTPE